MQIKCGITSSKRQVTFTGAFQAKAAKVRQSEVLVGSEERQLSQ